MADEGATRYPFWAYAVVGVAIVLAFLWLVSALVGFVVTLVKAAIVVVLAVALVAWAVGKKAER